MVFLDANIVLEVLLGRDKFLLAQEVISSSGNTSISILSVHLVFYFGLKEGVEKSVLEAAIEDNRVLGLAYEDYLWAKQNCVGYDFEDALQVAIAIRSGCTEFVTLNKTLAQNYKKHLKMTLP